MSFTTERGKRVFVTGGRGFLGAAVMRELRVRGAQAFAPSRTECDLLGVVDIVRARQDYQPEIVIHLAAFCGGIGLNAESGESMFRENMGMGLNLLNVMLPIRDKIERLLLAGSVCAYPKHSQQPMREADIWSGYPEETNAMYGIAKRSLMSYGAACRETGLNVVSAIPANLYGPSDHFEDHRSHVTPAIIRKMVEAKESGAESVTLWGTGKATRDFLYVTDAARGICDMAERYDGESPLNLGTGVETSIKDLATMIATAVGYEGRIEFDPSKPDGQPRRVLDCTRARAAIEWEPRVPLWEGLRETVAWYRESRLETALVAAANARMSL